MSTPSGFAATLVAFNSIAHSMDFLAVSSAIGLYKVRKKGAHDYQKLL